MRKIYKDQNYLNDYVYMKFHANTLTLLNTIASTFGDINLPYYENFIREIVIPPFEQHDFAVCLLGLSEFDRKLNQFNMYDFLLEEDIQWLFDRKIELEKLDN